MVDSSSQEFFPHKLFILVDCDIILLLCLMEEGEGEDVDGGHGGRVTSVFVMNLSRHFNFCNKAPPSGKIDWVQSLI